MPADATARVLAEVAVASSLRRDPIPRLTLEVAIQRWLRSRGCGGSAKAERRRLGKIAALAVAAVVRLDEEGR